MTLSGRHKFYWFLVLFTGVGWLWLFIAGTIPPGHFTPCLFKTATGLPCPSCGTTRSLLSLSHAHWAEAFMLNPFGYVLMLGILVLPAWMILDGINRRTSLYRTYTSFEKGIRKRPALLALIFLIIAANWIWNIYKHL